MLILNALKEPYGGIFKNIQTIDPRGSEGTILAPREAKGRRPERAWGKMHYIRRSCGSSDTITRDKCDCVAATVAPMYLFLLPTLAQAFGLSLRAGLKLFPRYPRGLILSMQLIRQ